MLLPEIDPEILLFKKKSDYLTDPSDSDDADMFTSQATQGYSEGLADNELESEVSSVFGLDPTVPDLPLHLANRVLRGQDKKYWIPLIPVCNRPNLQSNLG